MFMSRMIGQFRISLNNGRSAFSTSSVAGASPSVQVCCQPTSKRILSNISACRIGLRNRSPSASRINRKTVRRCSGVSSQVREHSEVMVAESVILLKCVRVFLWSFEKTAIGVASRNRLVQWVWIALCWLKLDIGDEVWLGCREQFD